MSIAYAAASAQLLDAVQKAGLSKALGTLRGFFLLARGDLVTTFLDTAANELAKSAADVSLTCLQSLLDLGEPLD